MYIPIVPPWLLVYIYIVPPVVARSKQIPFPSALLSQSQSDFAIGKQSPSLATILSVLPRSVVASCLISTDLVSIRLALIATRRYHAVWSLVQSSSRPSLASSRLVSS